MVSVLNEFGGVNKHGLTKTAFMKRKEEAGWELKILFDQKIVTTEAKKIKSYNCCTGDKPCLDPTTQQMNSNSTLVSSTIPPF